MNYFNFNRQYIVWITVVTLSLSILIFTVPNFLILNLLGTDDSFYYFTIARNLAFGNGVSFDGITVTNGFQPLWLILITPIFYLAKFDLYLPLRLTILLSSLIFSALLFVLMKTLQDFSISKNARWMAIFLFMLSPSTILLNPDLNTFLWLSGTEFVLTALILSLLFKLSFSFKGDNYSEYLLLGSLSGLALLSRLDSILIIFSFPLYLIFISKKFKLSVKNIFFYGLPPLIIVLPYLFYNYLNFSEFVPVSGQTKAYWNDIGNTVFGNLFDNIFNLIKAFIPSLWNQKMLLSWLLIFKSLAVLITYTLLFFWVVKKYVTKSAVYVSLIFFFSFSLLHFSFYMKSFGLIETKYWYWGYEYIISFFLVAHLIDDLWNRFIIYKLKGKYFFIFCFCLSPLLFAFDLSKIIKSSEHYYYLDRKVFLETTTKSTDIIGTPNAGALGYLTDRTIVNIDGLVNSYEYLQAQKDGTDLIFLRKIGVNKFFFSKGSLLYEPYKTTYRNQLEIINVWKNKEGKQIHELFNLKE